MTIVREIVADRPTRIFRTCVYCGTPCVGPACGSHRDLLKLDPHYQLLKRRVV